VPRENQSESRHNYRGSRERRLAQFTFAAKMGNTEAPNPCMVEAKHRAKWPPRGHSTEHKRGPNQLPREVPYEHDPNDLKALASLSELAILKRAAPGNLEVKTWYIERELFTPEDCSHGCKR
jgi:hypothetical protein